MDPPSRLDGCLASAGLSHEARVLRRLSSELGVPVTTILPQDESGVETAARATAAAAAGEAGPPSQRRPRRPSAAARFEAASAATIAALQRRAPLIHQAALADGFLGGYADILVRDDVNPFVTGGSPDAYSVLEVKLAGAADADYILQAATYADLLRAMLPTINQGGVDGGGKGPRSPPLQPVRHLLLWLCSATADPMVVPAADAVAAQRALALAYRAYVDAFDVTAPVPPPVALAGSGGGANAEDILSAAVESPLGRLRPWTGAAAAALVASDSLLRVAGMRRATAERLATSAGITTLSELAAWDGRQRPGAPPLPPPHVVDAMRLQARLQVATAEARSGASADVAAVAAAGASNAAGGTQPPPLPPPAYEVVHPPTLSTCLPPAGAADLYFDIEGYPLAEAGGVRTGLEYLLGDVDAAGRFTAVWAHDAAGEEAAFIGFIERVWAARAASLGRPLTCAADGGDGGPPVTVTAAAAAAAASVLPPPAPSPPPPLVLPAPPPPRVYHYGAYEVSAFRRLAARAATPAGIEAARRFGILEAEGAFVDLYALIRGSIRIGEESYSIKAVERLMGVSRAGADLADAASSVALYYDWRRSVYEADEGQSAAGASSSSSATAPTLHPTLVEIEAYNQQDCESLRQLVDWLRATAVERGIPLAPLSPPPSLDPTDAPPPPPPSLPTDVGLSCAADDSTTAAADVPAAVYERGACGARPADKAADSAVIAASGRLAARVLGAADGSPRRPLGPPPHNNHADAAAAPVVAAAAAATAAAETRRLAAGFLGFHARESVPAKARFTDRIRRAAGGNAAAASLYDDDEVLAGATLRGEADVDGDAPARGGSGRRPPPRFYTYAVPPQAWRVALPAAVAVVPADAASATAAVAAAATDAGVPSSVAAWGTVVDAEDGEVTLRLPGIAAGAVSPPPPPALVTLVSTEGLTLCPSALRAGVYAAVEELVGGETGIGNGAIAAVPDATTTTAIAATTSTTPMASPPALSPPPSYPLPVAAFTATTPPSASIAANFLRHLPPTDTTGRPIHLDHPDNLLPTLLGLCPGGTLVVQGPPGTGKTRLSASVIADLVVHHGKTVAVCSNSHAAVDNLLAAVVAAGVDGGRVAKVGSPYGSQAGRGHAGWEGGSPPPSPSPAASPSASPSPVRSASDENGGIGGGDCGGGAATAARSRLSPLLANAGVPYRTATRLDSLTVTPYGADAAATTDVSAGSDGWSSDEGADAAATAQLSSSSSGRRGGRRQRRGRLPRPPVQVVGATAFVLARPAAAAAFDYLFVDEAGQLAAAHYVAIARSARTAGVLVGDQQQLDMPVTGAHPRGADVSALSAAAGAGVRAVAPNRGLFLSTTHRLPPAVAAFVSDSLYDGRLVASSATAAHRLVFPPIPQDDDMVATARPGGRLGLLAGRTSGLVFLPRDSVAVTPAAAAAVAAVAAGSPTVSAAEVAAVSAVVAELTGASYDLGGARGALSPAHILVVAPYNAQVAALASALDGRARVGTIDKFQGQQAPVVIVSLCGVPDAGATSTATTTTPTIADAVSSSVPYPPKPPDDPAAADDTGTSAAETGSSGSRRSARGAAAFVLHRQRLNVAITRAQCLAVVIGTTGLATPMAAASVEDVAAVSMFARLVEAGSGGRRANGE
ncbi:hypothetical protein MMPV_002043 [Pyropia vietnamensis]